MWDFSNYDLETLRRIKELIEELEGFGIPQDEIVVFAIQEEISWREKEDEPIEDGI